jgi:hypothetical protein
MSFLRNETTQANQTEFVDQVQFLDAKPKQHLSFKDLQKNKSLRPFYVLIIVLFLILFFTFLSIFLKKAPDPDPVFNQKEENVELGPLNQRVYELRETLKEHNPTKQSLPFPRVDLEFNIN